MTTPAVRDFREQTEPRATWREWVGYMLQTVALAVCFFGIWLFLSLVFE